MTKIGNKGFMMAEVVVVSVIVATTLVVLYTSVNRLTTAFNLRNRYHDLDCLNLAIAVNDELISSGDINTLIKDSYSTVVNTDIKNLFNNDYKRVNVYYIKNNTSLDINNINSNLNTTAKEYFEYLDKNKDNKYNYYIVSEMCETEDNCFYYGFGVR